MLKNTTCLNETELSHYLCGWLDDLEMLSAEQHLEQCQACELQLQKLEAQPVSLFPGLQSRLIASDDVATDHNWQADARWQQAMSEACKNSPESLRATPPSPTRKLGQYTLIRPIGRGGMAQVYLARHDRLKKEFAIKILRVPEMQLEESLQRIQREIEVVGRLRHPAIVAATDAGEAQGHPYLVTEFIDGLDLQRLAHRFENTEETISVPAACEMIRQAAIGLAHAHSQGVIHRDVKPSNLMLDTDGNIKILDFGLVRLEGWQQSTLELTSVGQMLGTLDYMAPEQAENPEAVDLRCDIYGLGATLYRLLAGRAPRAITKTQSPLEKLRLLSDTDPPKLVTLCPQIPEPLSALVDQCLSRDRKARPTSAAHLAEALQPFTLNADLVALQTQALKLPDRLPEYSASFFTWSHGLPGPNVSVSAQAGSRSGWWTGAMGLAVAMLTAFFGAAFFWLQEQQGQLVIESDSADVTIRLLQDGETYTQWEIHTGFNSTQLYAGNYEIQIDGPVDQYQLSTRLIELKRGEILLLRLRQKEAAGEENTRSATAENENKDLQPLTTPVFKGKPFAYWESVFKLDHSIDRREEAIQAMLSFDDETLQDRGKDALIDLVIDPFKVSGTSMNGTPRISDLSKAQWNRLAQAFDSADETGKELIFQDILTIRYRASEELRQSIGTWISTRTAMLPPLDDYLTTNAVDFLLTFPVDDERRRKGLHTLDIESETMFRHSETWFEDPLLRRRMLVEFTKEMKGPVTDNLGRHILDLIEGMSHLDQEPSAIELKEIANILDDYLYLPSYSPPENRIWLESVIPLEKNDWLVTTFGGFGKQRSGFDPIFLNALHPEGQGGFGIVNQTNTTREVVLWTLMFLQIKGTRWHPAGVRSVYRQTEESAEKFWGQFDPEVVGTLRAFASENNAANAVEASSDTYQEIYFNRLAWNILYRDQATDIAPRAVIKSD